MHQAEIFGRHKKKAEFVKLLIQNQNHLADVDYDQGLLSVEEPSVATAVLYDLGKQSKRSKQRVESFMLQQQTLTKQQQNKRMRRQVGFDQKQLDVEVWVFLEVRLDLVLKNGRNNSQQDEYEQVEVEDSEENQKKKHGKTFDSQQYLLEAKHNCIGANH